MEILIAPDAFKSCLTSDQVGSAILEGIKNSNIRSNCTVFPMADGGEGSLEVIKKHLNLDEVQLTINDPLFRPINTSYFRNRDTAFIELAKASGYGLLQPDERNPMHTSSFGTGELIKDAIDHGIRKIYLFLGGSSSNDGGIGIAAALGYSFLDSIGNTLEPVGKNLVHINRIMLPDIDFRTIDFNVLCDVKNPLYGPDGATYTYASQKGANKEEIEFLDKGLINFAGVLKNQLEVDVSKVEGGGAAGGISAGMMALCNAKMKRGFDSIASITGIEEEIKKADLVISGEGQLDDQTLKGKLIFGLAKLCQKHRKKLFLIVGNNTLEENISLSNGIDEVVSVLSIAKNFEDAMNNAERYISILSRELVVNKL